MVLARRLLFCQSPLALLSAPRGVFFRAGTEDTQAHAITVRQVLFDGGEGAPIPGKFTFNDRPPTGRHVKI